MVSVVQFFTYVEEPIGERANLYREIKFGAYLFLITHWFACLWFMVGCPDSTLTNIDYNSTLPTPCKVGSWTTQNGRNVGMLSTPKQYLVSLYWAVATTCAVGYGDVHAYLVSEMALALICMIVGVVFYGYIIASVAASLANADAQRARYQERLDAINRFLSDQEIDAKLFSRVKNYYEYIWLRNKGADLENMFLGLPISIQADISLSLYKDIIESVPLFQGYELGFTKMLSLYIKPHLCPKGEYIVRKGDIGQEMFFIHKGTVEVVSEHQTPIIFDTMEPGRFFGEISIIFSCPRTASVRTRTNVDMFVLSKRDLDEVLSHYPQVKKQIIETAEERQNMVKQRAAAAAAAAAKQKEEAAAERRKSEQMEAEKLDADKEKNGTNQNILDMVNEEFTEHLDVEVEVKTCRTRLVNVLQAIGDRFTKWNDFVIHKDSKMNRLQDFTSSLTFLSYITLTYMASFQHIPNLFIAFNIIADICFLIEMYLSAHKVDFTPTGEAVVEVSKLSRNYLKTRFRFDLLANFPFSIFCFAAPIEMRWQVFSYLNLVHVLRLIRLNQFFVNWLKRLNTNVLVIRMVEIVCQIILIIQTFACIWYAIACPGNICRPNTWIHLAAASGTSEKPISNWVDSFYWTVATMTSTGYGDIHPTNDLERVFAMIVMVFGKLLFGFVLGNVASTLANAESLRVRFEERFSAVQEHMKDQHMPDDIKSRVVKFFQYIWLRNRGSGVQNLFHDMPPCMHGELCLEIVGDLISKVPMFRDCSIPFLKQLCTTMHLIQSRQNEFITTKGDIGNEMYFIKKGKVEILHEESTPLACHFSMSRTYFGKDDFFGDECLALHRPHRYTARAITHVDMFALPSKSLQETLDMYPEESATVKRNIADMVYEATS